MVAEEDDDRAIQETLFLEPLKHVDERLVAVVEKVQGDVRELG